MKENDLTQAQVKDTRPKVVKREPIRSNVNPNSGEVTEIYEETRADGERTVRVSGPFHVGS